MRGVRATCGSLPAMLFRKQLLLSFMAFGSNKVGPNEISLQWRHLACQNVAYLISLILRGMQWCYVFQCTEVRAILHMKAKHRPISSMNISAQSADDFLPAYTLNPPP